MSSVQSPSEKLVEETYKSNDPSSVNTLPDNWMAVQLADITTPSKEKAEPSQFADKKYIGLEHIESSSNRLIGIGDITSVKSTKSVFRTGDVLYGKLRPYLKKVFKPDFDGVCSTDILVFPEVEHLDNTYLLHFLSQNTTADYATQNSNGINLPRINSKTLGEIDFPLPPYPEQTRIVSAIESLQAHSSKTRALIAEVKPLIAQLRQSVLCNAFNGRLTADWRRKQQEAGTNGSTQSDGAKHEMASELLRRIRVERRESWETAQLAAFEAKGKKPTKGWRDKYKEPEPINETGLPELPTGWCWGSIGQIAKLINGDRGNNYPNVNEYVATGLPFINTGHIEPNGGLSLAKMNYISQEKFDTLGSGKINEGDLVYCLRGATLGKTAFVAPFTKGAIASSLVIVRPELKRFREYIYYFLVSPLGRDEIWKYDNGSAQPNLSANSVTKYLVPIPTLVEVEAICNKIKESLVSISAIEQQLTAMQSSLTELDQSILSKAFRGELVPQDPNDEPASELLARIRATQEAAVTKKKPSKKKAASKKKTKTKASRIR